MGSEAEFGGVPVILIELLIIALIFLRATIMGAISKTITKNRGMRGGYWWGFCLGVVGIIVVTMRPKDHITVTIETKYVE